MTRFLTLLSALTASLLPTASRSRRLGAYAALVLLFVGMRSLAITADPPRRMFHGGLGHELFVEPTAKAHEARNWARFGSFKINEADNYQFWRAQAPAWVYPLALSFKTFGTTYLTLRVTAIALGLLGYLALIALAARRFGGAAAFLLAVFLSIDQVGIFHGRSGLLEPVVSSWIAVAMYFLDRATQRAEWVIAAALAAVVAFLTKQAAVPAVVMLLVYGVWIFLKAPGAPKPARARALIAVAVVAMVAGLLAYVVRDDYQRALTWNMNHVVMGKSSFGEVELDDMMDEGFGIDGVTSLATRSFRLLQIYPFMFSLAWLEVIRQLVISIRSRSISGRAWLAPLWFLTFFAGAVVPADFMMRFTLPMLLPATLCAAIVVWSSISWLRDLGRTRLALLPGLVALVAVGYQVAAISFVLARRQYTLEPIRVSLESHIGPRADAVVIGLWSAPLVFETPYRHFYVKSSFNATRESLEALKPTHLLLLQGSDYTRSIMEQQWPKALERSKSMDSYEVRGNEVTLFEITQPRLRLKR